MAPERGDRGDWIDTYLDGHDMLEREIERLRVSRDECARECGRLRAAIDDLDSAAQVGEHVVIFRRKDWQAFLDATGVGDSSHSIRPTK